MRAKSPVEHASLLLAVSIDRQPLHHHEAAAKPKLFAQRFRVIIKGRKREILNGQMEEGLAGSCESAATPDRVRL
jgi:hypothetical protein